MLPYSCRRRSRQTVRMGTDSAPFELKIRPSFFVPAAFLLLVSDSAAFLLSFLLACAVHEAGHLIAACGLKLPVLGLTLSGAGLELKILRRCSYWGDLLLAAAGPGASILLTAALCWFGGGEGTLLAGVSLILGCFNLLPVRPLDGGEMLQAALSMLFPLDAARSVAAWLGRTVCLLLILWGSALAGAGNPSLLFMGLWLLVCERKSSEM